MESIDKFSALIENVILPSIEKIKWELEQEGWYGIIGNLNPFTESKNLKESLDINAFGFTSLSIIDVENRPVQYVYIYSREKEVVILGDSLIPYHKIALGFDEVTEESMDRSIRKVLGLN